MVFDADAIARVVTDYVAPNAARVDAGARFPIESIDALREERLLGGLAMPEAAKLVEQLATACGSTAMVVLMHFAASAVIDAHGPSDVRSAVGDSSHFTTLAFSEAGSRSHFWAPGSRATRDGDDWVRLDARKSWVTSAAAADSYVWSSRPVAAEGPMTLWLVPALTPGLELGDAFDGVGLRGNGSVPITATSALIEAGAQLGDDGAGLDIALATALPWFLVLSTAFCLGLMEAVTAETSQHLTSTRLEHLDAALIEQPMVRNDFARMRLTTDTTRAFLADTLSALGSERPDAVLRVLESKAMAAEAAIDVTDLAMKVCGGAAFRKEVGIERRFRDAHAARVMAPTTDALLDFVGRAVSGLPLLGG
jgi:alkylation response protein AidB-like acyl-CoA dehydrogenase